jgi:hypothetical protein
VQARAFWKAVTVDTVDLLDQLLALLAEGGFRYCLVGGQALNAYVEPVVSLDLDLVVAADQVAELEAALRARFRVERFQHTLNVSAPGSDLRIQIQTDPRYADFVSRAVVRTVLGRDLPVARLEDVLDGKVWAAQDQTRQPSKRQKDLADIARILEARPDLRARVPADILAKLISSP